MQLTLPARKRISCRASLVMGMAAFACQAIAQEEVEEEVEEQRLESKSFRAARVEEAPVLDGVLDDAVWQQADRVDDFHQSRPGDHTEPSEPTELYVVYTSDALYIGARMYDREPELIAAPTIRHGLGLPFDDRLVVIAAQGDSYITLMRSNCRRHPS